MPSTLQAAVQTEIKGSLGLPRHADLTPSNGAGPSEIPTDPCPWDWGHIPGGCLHQLLLMLGTGGDPGENLRETAGAGDTRRLPQSYTRLSLETSRHCLLIDGRLVTSWSIQDTSCQPQMNLSTLAVQTAPYLAPNPYGHSASSGPDGAIPRWGGPFSEPQLLLLSLWQVPMGKMGRGPSLFYRIENPRVRPLSAHG